MDTQAPAENDPACYVACMHNPWDKTAFRRLLRRIMSSADLAQQDVAELAGISRPQVSRWLGGEHRPRYDAITQLAASLRQQHPELGDLPDQLLAAAGYPVAASVRPGDDRPADLRFADDAEMDGLAEQIWNIGRDDSIPRPPDRVLRLMIELARQDREGAHDTAPPREHNGTPAAAAG